MQTVIVLGRYLQDLPQGLSTFNDTCIAQQKDHPMVHQNKEHVRSIVQVRPMSFVCKSSNICQNVAG